MHLVGPSASGGSKCIWWVQVHLVGPSASGGSKYIWWVQVHLVGPSASGGSKFILFVMELFFCQVQEMWVKFWLYFAKLLCLLS